MRQRLGLLTPIACGLLMVSTTWTGLSLSAALAGLIAVLLGVGLLARYSDDLSRRPYLLAAAATMVGLLSIRSFLGRYDIGNLPSGFVLRQGEYNRAALLASVSVILMLATYVVLSRPRSAPRPVASSLRLTSRSIHNLRILGFGAMSANALLTLMLGVGRKDVKSVFPFQGVVTLGTDAVLALAAVTLMLAGLADRTRHRRLLYEGLLLLIVNLALGTFGGARGEVFHVLLLFFGAALIASNRRFESRSIRRFALVGLAAIIPLTRLSLNRRLDVTGGADFSVVDFLALRVSGMNRFAPVVARDRVVGWPAFSDTRRLIIVEIYELRETAETGIGAPAIGVGYLAAGIAGMLLISIAVGAVAALGDARIGVRQRPIWLAFHVVAAEMFLSAVTEFRPSFGVRSLIALVVCAVALNAVIHPETPPATGPSRTPLPGLRRSR